MRYLLSAVLLVLLAAPALAAQSDCQGCHEKISPAAVRHWRQSAHAGKVDCAGCHGSDHEKLKTGEVKVSAETCGKCHPQAYRQHRSSRHGLGLHSGWGCTRNLPQRNQDECRFCHRKGSSLPVSKVQCARFLEQTSEMGALGCNRCHEVESSCASCHTDHQTDLRIVRDPRVCAKCHMGPDHPQWEMWETSRHGQLYLVGGSGSGPSCQDCHMPAGSHDVSTGITVSPAGKPHPEAQGQQARSAMLAICSKCHAPGFATRELAAGDRIRQQSQALVTKARGIIEKLADQSLLQPMPADRPAHPLRGKQLVLDGQMLYENISHIERLYFKMQKYDDAKTWKGAYHQNPDYTHWYGNAELKMDLVDIQAEARRLRQAAARTGPPAKVSPLAGIEAGLKELKRRFDRGGMDADAYARQKRLLLDRLPAAGGGGDHAVRP